MKRVQGLTAERQGPSRVSKGGGKKKKLETQKMTCFYRESWDSEKRVKSQGEFYYYLYLVTVIWGGGCFLFCFVLAMLQHVGS